MTSKQDFENNLRELSERLTRYVSTDDGQWAIKGFIDIYRNIYTISSDTKIISKILEIHLFPTILEFAKEHNFDIVLAEHQNYYPDISFVFKENENIKFAVDIKTTYREIEKTWLCNGFTLGSHGQYFEDRKSTKNIQFPYSSYSGHFCLGAIYDRIKIPVDETSITPIENLDSITSVISNIQFFVAEKWKIASDKSGSGNTANIGSITRIDDIVNGRGMFSNLGEAWFDDYWVNYGKISIRDENGNLKRITSLKDFVAYRGGDSSQIFERNNKE